MSNTEALRIIFMGTAEFAVPSLNRLVEAGKVPIAIATGPDKKQGRGQKIRMTPVKEAALSHGIPTILQPESVKDPSFAEEVAALQPDIIVVVAYRILPPSVYEAARLGAFNLHGSLLPRYRGAAPIQRSVMAGDTETGVTTFFLERKVDTGTMILQRAAPIEPDDTAGDVYERLKYIGAEVVLETVQAIEEGNVQTQLQDDSLATPAPKLFREDGRIPWDQPASVVYNHIRGVTPVPGAWTIISGNQLKVYRSEVVPGDGAPGLVLHSDNQLVVACGSGALALHEVQLAGKRRLSVTDFLRGFNVPEGMILGQEP